MMTMMMKHHRIDPAVLAHAYPNAFAGHVRAEFDRSHEAANQNAITCAPGHASLASAPAFSSASAPFSSAPASIVIRPRAMRAVEANVTGGAGHAVAGALPAL
jgi:hypothetical protein